MPSDARAVSCPQRLRDVLLGHLACPWVTVWPGADGVTVEEVLASYPEAVAVGQAPGLAELLADHPELREALEDFFEPARPFDRRRETRPQVLGNRGLEKGGS